MTPDDFRRIALGMEGAVESAHMGHPDFRVNRRIFATLGYPDRKWGMVNLTPEQQRTYVREHSAAFVPVKGVWGEQGSTTVRLDAIDEETLGAAMTLAWQNTVKKGPAARPARKALGKPTSPSRNATRKRTSPHASAEAAKTARLVKRSSGHAKITGARGSNDSHPHGPRRR